MAKLFFDNQAINTSVKEYLERKLVQFNNIKYAYAIMSKRNPADFSIISNRQEWFKVYIENNFQFIDPVLITALYRMTPFSWDENLMLNKGVKVPKLFDMARNHDIINGYTFVLHDHNNNLVVLSIMLDKHCDDNIEELIQLNKDKLQMLLITTHEKLTQLYQEQSRKADFEEMNTRELFTSRENEIIYWASVGKSYQEIALILGIKLTTVKYHIGNAVKKLGVTNAKHAIRLGIELNLIRPVLPDGE
ncbi:MULTISPECIES: helix-turn-helix transcriptional regulator [Erwiniaceae]|jgi:LuxR family quorum-sensing system transcriptional regulator ExpR|uniref:Quorum-sensing transcriptional regulator n=1 Tax=Erwinia billingiae (strain Eb661) TaxID=634500 RepID=D8MP94_ERWBE|nr:MULTISPECIES: LuxR family transcriptional regulator [Erwinia]MBN7121308.1 LuxR family transcriptional regulator [Erwinia billingiae]MCX0499576.1 LuxR family transcriptional regulator [Erwinia billingiae]QBR50811.1 LuxR family transcriptional regulator [Erwinia sp. QL-Z3]CAX58651.1 Quorum-sensing transcriptional regulator [Erwinia billingiae Eb661]